MLKYISFSEVTQGMRDESKYIAERREKANSGNTDPYYQRGSLSKRVDELGILGELSVRRSLDLNGVPYAVSPLLDKKPVVNHDVQIGSLKFDVKGTNRSYKVYVNERAHNKKPCDGYLFAWIDKNICRIYVVPYFEVSTWEINTLAYTPAYCYSSVLVPAALESLWHTLSKLDFEEF